MRELFIITLTYAIMAICFHLAFIFVKDPIYPIIGYFLNFLQFITLYYSFFIIKKKHE
jgi:hypothetical protein